MWFLKRRRKAVTVAEPYSDHDVAGDAKNTEAPPPPLPVLNAAPQTDTIVISTSDHDDLAQIRMTLVHLQGQLQELQLKENRDGLPPYNA